MMQLVRICGENWPAVERDLLTLGYTRDDIGTPKLTLWQLISIVVSSPPGTAVYHAETRHNQLTPEGQMLAAMSGINAGPNPNGPAAHSASLPKVDSFAALPDYGGMKLEAHPVDEFVQLRAKLAEEAQERARAGKGGDKVTKDEYNPFAKRGVA